MFSLPLRRPLVAAALLATLTAACGGGDSTTGPTPTPTPTVATITVVNHAPSGSAMFLRDRACGASSWGSDHLGSEILWQDEQVSFEVDAGCYDIRVTPSEVGLDYLYFTNVTVAAGESRTLEITEFPLES